MVVEKELVFFNIDIKDKEQLFEFMSEKLMEKDYVTDQYLDKIKEREQNYPTGFKLETLNIAIPHTDPMCSKINKVIAIKPKHKIDFINAEDGEHIKVELVLGLVFKSGENHMDTLMKISQVLQDVTRQQSIISTKSEEEFYKVVSDILQ